MRDADPFELGLLDLELRGRHLGARLQRHDRDLARPEPHRGPGGVQRGGRRRRDAGVIGIRRLPSRTSIGDLTQGRTGGVKRHVPTSNHYDAFAQVHPEPLVDVEQELHGPEHPIELGPWDLQIAATHGADRDEHRGVFLSQLGQGEIGAQAAPEAQLDPEVHDRGDLGLEHVTS